MSILVIIILLEKKNRRVRINVLSDIGPILMSVLPKSPLEHINVSTDNYILKEKKKKNEKGSLLWVLAKLTLGGGQIRN